MSISTLRQHTPFLLNETCAKYFSSWCEQQNLNQTNRDMEQVQNRINTGLAIASAKDNGGVYAIAQKMRSDVAGYGAVGQSLDLAASTTDVALAAGEAIGDILIEMKEKALAGSDNSLDTASRTALNEDFKLHSRSGHE